MNKKDIKYYSIIVAILIATIVFEIMKPKPIDWRFTLEAKDKIPYGTYVIRKTLKDIFPKQKIYKNNQTTYEFNKVKDNYNPTNYIYITKEFKIDELETKTIISLAEEGSNIFISAYYFSNIFADTLNFEIDNTNFFDTTSYLNFYNKKLKRTKPYFYGKMAASVYFKKIDTAYVQVLASAGSGKVTFIRQQIGKGFIYVNLTPEIFTNYGMITEKNYNFAYKSLSYLPKNNVVWDKYYKPFREQEKGYLTTLYKFPALKMAYILLLISVLVFVFFASKRKQRIIPIIKPYKNQTLEFVETIGRVYYSSKNHKDIAEKKWQYFSNFLLRVYSVNITVNESFLAEKLSEKTAVKMEIVKKLLYSYNKINKLEKVSEEQLNKFNNYIEDFYENCK